MNIVRELPVIVTSMDFPRTNEEFYKSIAQETARMSYPGSMSRGTKPVVRKGTKFALEKYYVQKFPLNQVLSSLNHVTVFDQWHKARTNEIAIALKRYIPEYNNSAGVSAKFLNTFMHQLMKYKQYQVLWPVLHLPLDAKVFNKLKQIKYKSLDHVQPLFSYSPYHLSYSRYLNIQQALEGLLQELNNRRGAEFKLTSRIELNFLWL